MNWEIYKNGFLSYLMLERSLSKNSIAAYEDDVNKLIRWIEITDTNISVEQIQYNELEKFVHWLNELGLGDKSQARIISVLRPFINICCLKTSSLMTPLSCWRGPSYVARFQIS